MEASGINQLKMDVKLLYLRRLFLLLTLDGRGANYECLLEGLSLGAELGGSGLQGHALLC